MAPSKIQDQELLEFLEETGRRRASMVLYAWRKKHVSVHRAPGALPKVRLTGAAVEADAMAQLEADLERLGLAERARRNGLAQVFVLELTRRELRAVAELSSVMRIRPNRWLLPIRGELFLAAQRGLLKNGRA